MNDFSELYKAVVESSSDVIVVIQDKIVKFVNKRITDFSGFREEDVLGKDFTLFVPEEKRTELLQKHKERMAGGPEHDFYETEVLAKDGLKIPVEINSVRIEYGGGPAGLVIIRDIRKKKKLESIVKRNEDNLNRAQSVAHIGSWYLNIPQNELWWSRETYHIFGVPEGEKMTYEKFLSFVYEDDKPKVDRAWKDALRHETYDIEHRVIINGEVKWVKEGAEVVFDSQGNPVEGIGTVQDITESKKKEEVLQQSEELYRTLAEASHDMIFVVNREGVIEFVNSFAAKYLKKAKDEVIGKQMIELFPRDVVDRQWESIQHVLRVGKPLYFENPWDFTGTTVWLGTWLVPLLDSEGNPTSIMGVSRDITDRKTIEIKLDDSEKRFRGIFEQSPFSTQIFRPDGTVLGINNAFRKLWGAEGERGDFVVAHYNILQDEQLKEMGLMPHIEKGFGGEFSELPEVLYDPKKTEMVKDVNLKAKWVLGYIRPIKDDKGVIRQVVLMHEDITGKREAERKLKEKVSELEESQKALFNVVDDLEDERKKAKEAAIKLEIILENLGEGVVVIDGAKDGIIMFANRTAGEMLGWDPKNMVGKPYQDVWNMQDISGNRLDEDERAIAQSIKTHEVVSTEKYFYVRRDGRKFPVSISVWPIVVDGKFIGVIDLFRDITGEIALNKAREELISLASHQLRTPLTIVSWYAEELISEEILGGMTDIQKEYVHTIYDGNKRMIRILNNMLSVSRLELGTFAVSPEQARVTVILDTVLENLSLLRTKKEVEIIKKYDDKEKNLFVDPKLVSIIFENIISNAIKYSFKGGRIEISSNVLSEGLQIDVRDYGCGVPELQRQSVFQKLFRADNARIIDQDGTGLGLYIVKLILDQVRGRIWFESEEGKGSTFHVLIPGVMQQQKGTKRLE